MPIPSTPNVLYPFKLLDSRTRKWRLARWKASLEEVERLGGEVCGEPVTYSSLGNTSDFLRELPIQPFQRTACVEMHPHCENPPAIQPLEQFLAQTFLRRYATWCIRKKRYAAAQGAAALHVELASLHW